MIRLFRILCMNAWRGLRSYDGVLMAMALIFASVGVLAIGSKADAAFFHSTTNKIAGDIRTQSNGLALVMKARDSMQNPAKSTHKRPVGLRNTDADQLATALPTNSNADGPKSTVPSQPEQFAVESVQLTPAQPACQQGQTEVQSVQVTLQKPAPTSTTLTWYWETRIDTGTNTSGSSPISDTQNSQNLAAGATTVSFTAGNSSQPLLSASASSDYAYSFRLHILADGTDTTSVWISVPELSGCQ